MMGMGPGGMMGGGNKQRMIEERMAWMESEGGEPLPEDQAR